MVGVPGVAGVPWIAGRFKTDDDQME